MSNISVISSGGVTVGTPLPSSAVQGTLYINTATNTLYVYYAGSWQVVAVLSSTTSFLLLQDGFSLLLETGDHIVL